MAIRTDWHRVVAFAGVGEYAATLPKGSHVLIQGTLRSREYEKDGVKQRAFELRADTIGKLDRVVRKQNGDPIRIPSDRASRSPSQLSSGYRTSRQQGRSRCATQSLVLCEFSRNVTDPFIPTQAETANVF
jgi:single-stranded DNA-binding protein